MLKVGDIVFHMNDCGKVVTDKLLYEVIDINKSLVTARNLESKLDNWFDIDHLGIWNRSYAAHEPQTAGCIHDWKDYVGFSLSYKYCSVCDEKKAS